MWIKQNIYSFSVDRSTEIFVTVQCPHSYKMFQIYFKSAGALLI